MTAVLTKHAVLPTDDRSFPALRALNLADEELIALRKQGYLQADERCGGAVAYWRLRFRFHGRTRSVYLGNKFDKVERVRDELARLQDPRVAQREWARLERFGRTQLRAAKARLAPLLFHLGYHFHGDAIRKLRTAVVVANPIKLKEGEVYGRAV